jgi:hypothetical protein
MSDRRDFFRQATSSVRPWLLPPVSQLVKDRRGSTGPYSPWAAEFEGFFISQLFRTVFLAVSRTHSPRGKDCTSRSAMIQSWGNT